MMVNMALPMGVDVSKTSLWETKSMPTGPEFVQGLHQLLDAPSKAAKAKDQNHVEGPLGRQKLPNPNPGKKHPLLNPKPAKEGDNER